MCIYANLMVPYLIRLRGGEYGNRHSSVTLTSFTFANFDYVDWKDVIVHQKN
jgi:hypothetical protein